MPSFYDFSLQPTTLTTLTNMEITEPTPIQAEAIPALLAGNDLVGQSATGSGKTLAYGVPLVERLARTTRVVQALVLVPTRELAVQVNTVLSKLAASRKMTTALLVGGHRYGKQLSALRYGAHIVVGTPGRVKDHIDRGTLVLDQVRICILDEADQMLDIGFAPAVEEILATTPATRQTALFSATMPDWITKLEQKFLKDPVKVAITPATGGQSTIEQIAYQVPQNQKIDALCTLLQSAEGESTLIFGRTKFGVEKLGQQLSKLGFTVGTLHGDKTQRAREDVLTAFRRGQVQTLLATNVAARGLDIQGIYQVINYELPESSDLFTHRIGRTGRMGRQGKAITLLVPSDLSKWRRMARNLGQSVILHRLTINEVTTATSQPAQPTEPATAEEPHSRSARSTQSRPSASRTQEHTQPSESEAARKSKPLPSAQEREPRNKPKPLRERQPSPVSDHTSGPARRHEPSPFAQEDEPFRERRPARRYESSPFVQEDEPFRERRPARRYEPSPFAQEDESFRERRPARRYEPSPFVQEDEPFRERRPAGPKYDRFSESRSQGSKKTNNSGRTPAHIPGWQSEGFQQPPERPWSEPKKHNQRGADKRFDFNRTASKRKAHPFVTTEGQARTRSMAAPVGRTRRNASAKRSASR